LLRLIQVGIGSFGWSWINIVKESKYWDPVAYVDLNEEMLRKAVVAYNVPEDKCYTSLDEALNEIEADAVLIVVPPAAHAETTIKALIAGLHVLVEKPLANTMEDAKKMVAEAKRRNLKLMVSQNYRFRRGARTIKRLLETKKVGEPNYAIVNFHKSTPYKGFRVKMACPILVDMAIHHFDLMRYFFNTDPRSLYAETWKPKWSWFEGDPCAAVIVNMEKDLKITYIGSWVSLGWETTWDGDWRIECSHGEIHWKRNGGSLLNNIVKVKLNGIRDAFEERLVSTFLEDRAYSLYEFAKAIRQDREPETNGEDNLKSLAMVFAAMKSAKSGKQIPIQDYL